MISEDEEALICDLAETYNIYDYKQLPPTRVAVFAFGLKDTSRIKMKLSGQRVPLETLLLAGIVDRLSFLVWGKTMDGQKGINRPTMVTDTLLDKKQETDVIVFSTSKDFEETRSKLIKDIQAGGE